MSHWFSGSFLSLCTCTQLGSCSSRNRVFVLHAGRRECFSSNALHKIRQLAHCRMVF